MEVIFSLGTINKLSRIAPIILRFSDYWPLTGHCAYPGDCNKWKKICRMSKSFNLSVNWIGSDKKIMGKKKEFLVILISL